MKSLNILSESILILMFCLNSFTNANELTTQEYLDMAKSKAGKGDNKGALQDYSKAIELNPEYHEAYIQRGELYGRMLKPNAAINDLNRALEIAPNNPEALSYRAMTKILLGDSNGAILDANKSIKLGADNSLPYAALGLAYMAEESFDLSLKYLTTALEINPNNSDALIGRAQVKALKGNSESALLDLKKAKAVNPYDPNVLVAIGNIKLIFQDYEGALDNCAKAIELYNQYKPGYICMGIANLSLGNKKKACLDFSKAGHIGAVELQEMIKTTCN